MAVTGCPDNCLHTETQDLALVPAYQERDGIRVLGFNVLAGGKLGSGGYRIAGPLDVFVTAPRSWMCAAPSSRPIAIMDRGTLATLLAWRSCWTIGGRLRFRAELEAQMGRPLCRGGVNARKPSVKDHVGIYRQKQAGLNYAGLKVPVGRIRAQIYWKSRRWRNDMEMARCAFLPRKQSSFRISPIAASVTG